MTSLPKATFALPLVILSLAGNASAQCQGAQLVVAELEAMDYLGQSCALHGDTAVLARRHAAHVWTRAGEEWTLEGGLFPSDLVSHGGVEHYYADLSGDTAVVAAPYHDEPVENVGAVWVFERSGGAWIETAKLQSSRLEADGAFGEKVALQGDRLAVAARLEDPGGAVYVFERSGATWTETARLVTDDAAAADYLGFGLALDGDTLLAGAFGDDVVGTASGSAYVFTFDGASWQQQAKLEGSAVGSLANFGFSVALSGEVAVVGAPYQLCPPFSCSGQAYVFRRQGTTWSEEALLLPSDPPADTFGEAVAHDGASILVGAPDRVVEGIGTFTGRTYRFVQEGGAWSEYARFLSLEIDSGHRFGESLDIDGDRALVGAVTASIVAAGSGAGYVFELDCAEHARYCESAPNSSGQPARIGFRGSHEVLAGDVVLHASGCPSETFGVFVYGGAPAQYPLGGGTLCISPYAPGILRLLPVVQTDVSGHVERPLDFGALPLGGTIGAGSTWYFQLWFRDSAAGASAFDLSDGLRVTFCP